MIIFINSPLDQFEVVSIITLTAPILGNFVLSLTNLGLYCILSVVLIVSLHVLSSNEYRLIPSRWSIAIESSYASIQGLVRDQIGSSHEIYTPFIYSLFWFVLVANLNGNIPYGFTVTTSGIASIGLSVLVFIGVTLLGLYLHGLRFFSYFVPENTPIYLVPLLVLIETISYLARAVSLGVRVFANMVAGHTLIKILSTFLGQLFTAGPIVAVVTLIPFVIFVALIGLEIAVSFIQAYVLCVLTSSYIKDSIQLH